VRPLRSAPARVVSLAVGGALLTLLVATIAIDGIAHRSGLAVAGPPGWVDAWRGAILGTVFAVLAWRTRAVRVIEVTLLVASAAFGAAGLAAAVANWMQLGAPASELGDAHVLAMRLALIGMAALPLVLVVFPDGRLPAGPGRVVAVVSAALCAVPAVAAVVVPASTLRNVAAPLGIDLRDVAFRSLGADPLAAGVVVAYLIGLAFAIVVLFARFPRASPAVRQQLRWLVWAGAVYLALALLLRFAFPHFLAQMVLLVGLVFVGAVLVITLTSRRLDGIDRLLTWSVVYVIVALAVLAVDVALITLVGNLVTHQTLAIASMLIVLFVYSPVRDHLLRLVSNVANGRRGDPYGVMSALASRLEDAAEPDDQLRHIARSVGITFASPYVNVSITQPDGRVIEESHGIRSGPTLALPLTYRGERIGTLELARGRRSRLSLRDEQLLADLVRQAAAAVRATILSRELQGIREQLVNAREDERRRLRRDLHDGLGPRLAAVRLRIETARNVGGDDPERARSLLAAAEADVAASVADIRRLAHDLRPPALDELGLVASIEHLAAALALGDHGFTPRLDLPRGLDLPAALEVATYRIVSEAVMNAQRHAAASTVWVMVRDDDPDWVEIEVADDGRGMPTITEAGVGLRSMRERALELGGRLEVTPRDGGGTVVRARLPLPRPLRQEQPLV